MVFSLPIHGFYGETKRWKWCKGEILIVEEKRRRWKGKWVCENWYNKVGCICVFL